MKDSSFNSTMNDIFNLPGNENLMPKTPHYPKFLKKILAKMLKKDWKKRISC